MSLYAAPAGVLLPSSLIHTQWFGVLAAFVAINTVIYVTLAIGKMLPKIYVNDYIHHAERRGQTRSIHPDSPRDDRTG